MRPFQSIRSLLVPVLLYWVLVLVRDLYLSIQFSGTGTCTCMQSTGTCTGTWTAGTGTGTGTCDKVLVAKTKSFSAVIDTLWHLYLRLTQVSGLLVFMSKFHYLALFGGICNS